MNIDGKINSKNQQGYRELRTIIILCIAGMLLGCFAKFLDDFSVNDSIWWEKFLDILNLRNVFSRISVWVFLALIISLRSINPIKAAIHVFVFLGCMFISYYLYTIILCGFFPKTYMIRWAVLCLLTPFFGILMWYAKEGNGILRILLTMILICFFLSQAISFGRWYISISYLAETVFLILSVILLYSSKKQILISIAGGIILMPLMNQAIHGILSGL